MMAILQLRGKRVSSLETLGEISCVTAVGFNLIAEKGVFKPTVEGSD